MIRKGLGKNQGKGYKNMVVKDPMVHSMSAKGIKSQVRMNNPIQPPYTPNTKPTLTFMPVMKNGSLDSIMMFSDDKDKKSKEPNVVEKVIGGIIGVIANEALKH